MSDIDTGDHVHHAPSGEDWVVAYVRGGRLAWCGWPQGEAECLDDAAAGDGTARSNLERRIAWLTQTNAGGRLGAA